MPPTRCVHCGTRRVRGNNCDNAGHCFLPSVYSSTLLCSLALNPAGVCACRPHHVVFAPMRSDFRHLLEIPTRWHDNDIYGHVNNVEYYAFFDTVINGWLIREGGLDIQRGEVVGLCAESHCTFLAELEFPETVRAALRVAHLGRSSVRYELALFGEHAGDPAAEGWFVHVFVDRETRRPAEIPPGVRAALERLVVSPS